MNRFLILCVKWTLTHALRPLQQYHAVVHTFARSLIHLETQLYI